MSRLTSAAITLLFLPAANAVASCLPVVDPLLLPISDMVGRDPAAAIRMAGAALADREILSTEIRGRVIALQAEGYGRLSQAEDARRVAYQGLELPLSANSEARAELLWIASTNTFGVADLTALRPQVEHAAAFAPDRARSLCLAIALGSIHRMNGDFSAAARQLFDAYRRSDGQGLFLAHAEATRLLARLWGDVGNDAAALELNQAIISFESAHGNDFMLSMAHGFRGIYLNNLGRFTEAILELDRAGISHRQSPASIGVAYINKELCRAFIGLKQWNVARVRCERARTEFKRFGEAGLPHTELLTAEIDIAQNRHADARARLDTLIAENNGPAFLNAFEPFRLRAEINRHAGDLPAALSDQYQYIGRYKRWKDAVTARQTLILGAQFTADLQVAKAEALQETLHAERTKADAHRMSLLASIGALALALIIVFRMHFQDIRHRRLLADAANTDELTGLPNRRHVLDRATAMLTEARNDGRKFSLAILDLDHFKSINDTYGHSAGDLVLKGVAAAAVGQLPQDAIMGRWGGEEFVIVFCDVGPEDCIIHLQSLRNGLDRIKPHPEAVVNFSAGLSDDDNSSASIEQIIDQADRALYRAKAGGRGRTVYYYGDQAADWKAH